MYSTRMPYKPGIKLIEANIPERMYEEFAQVAKQSERSIAGELRLAIKNHLKKTSDRQESSE